MMQKNANNVFSLNFINLFKKSLVKTYQYEQYMDFLIVPSPTFSKTLSYVPLLSYTDRLSNNIKDLLELAKENNFQIKTLDFDCCDFKKDDPVTMRLYIKDKKDIIGYYKSRTRGYVRKALKKDYELKEGINHIDDFYKILKQTYKKHGTPLLPKNLFLNIHNHLKEKFHLFVLYKNCKPVATMLVLEDKHLFWYGWGGVLKEYSCQLAGYAIYHLVIDKCIKDYQVKIFDFGRSPYKGGTYQFKSNFGAKPIKIDIKQKKEKNIYKTYKTASILYKKLPFCISDKIGPILTKYLVDL